MPDRLQQAIWTIGFYGYLLMFAIGIYVVNLVCLVLTFFLPQSQARRFLRHVVYRMSRLYLRAMLLSGSLKVNCDLLSRLRPGSGGRLIIANHPSILDAPLFLGRIPGLVCVFKSSLKRSFTFARTARTLGFLGNDEGLFLLKDLAKRLQEGDQVLLFPEGTRTSEEWINPFNPGYALAAIRARVPVQLVRIRTNSPILTKRQHFLKAGRFPVIINIDFGPTIEPGTFHSMKQFNAYVEGWYRANMAAPGTLRRPFLPPGHSTDVSTAGIRASFQVPGDPFYCHGHMPGNPLVPAYAQTSWVHELMDQQTAGGLERIGFFRWKFLHPLLPGDSVEILVGPPAARRDVTILRNGERVTHGKIMTEPTGEPA